MSQTATAPSPQPQPKPTQGSQGVFNPTTVEGQKMTAWLQTIKEETARIARDGIYILDNSENLPYEDFMDAVAEIGRSVVRNIGPALIGNAEMRLPKPFAHDALRHAFSQLVEGLGRAANILDELGCIRYPERYATDPRRVDYNSLPSLVIEMTGIAAVRGFIADAFTRNIAVPSVLNHAEANRNKIIRDYTPSRP